MEILKIKENVFNYFIYLILIFVSVFLVFYVSPLTSGDTPHYDIQSNILLEQGFIDYLKLILTKEFDKPFLLYLGTIIYTSIFKLFFNDLWKHFFILGNLSLSFYIFVSLFKNLESLKISKLIFIFLFISNIAQNVWNFYILGDTLYYFIICLIFFLIIKNISTDTFLGKKIIPIFILSILAIFTRPSGIFLIGFYTMLSIFFFMFEKKKNYQVLNYIFLSIFFILILFSIFFSIVSKTDISFESSFFSRVYEIISTGVVIDTDKPDKILIIDIGNGSIFDYLYFFIFKFFYTFNFLTNYWSFKHNLINFFVYIPLYFSFFYSVINFKNFNYIDKKKIIVCVTLISSVALFCALTVIDYSFRLRLAIYCPIYYMLILNLRLFKSKMQNNKFSSLI